MAHRHTLSQTQHALGAHESQPEKNYAIHAQTASTGARLRRIPCEFLGNGVSAAPKRAASSVSSYSAAIHVLSSRPLNYLRNARRPSP